MRVFTINVIEYEGEVIRNVVAFPDPEGNKEAEELFSMIIREHGGDDIEVEIALDNGFWEKGDGYQIFLTHSS